MRGSFAAIVLIVVGAFWLLTNLGYINVSLVEVAKTWWPLLLVGTGVALLFTNRGQKE